MRPYLILLFCLLQIQVFGAIRLPSIFGDNMVLQRNHVVTFYGWANPGEQFTLTTGWDNARHTIITSNNAKWSLSLPTPDTRGAFELKFEGGHNTIKLSNVMLGDLWLCAGQSNMEWSANNGIINAEAEINAAEYPNIRLFTVAKSTSKWPQEDVDGQWESCAPSAMADFSAVAYFYAKEVYKKTGVPIGLIDASWGASSAEVWTPDSVFREHPNLVEQHKLLTENQWVTTERSQLFNAMIAPLRKVAISGVLWYQGESNTVNAGSYTQLFTQMVRAWRKAFDQDFPFYYVQIAPYRYGAPKEGVRLREAQRRALALEHTAMVVTADIGDIEDIHPKNKQDVGKRLARVALKEHYGLLDETVYGPLFKNAKFDGDRVMPVFEYAEGLYFKDGDKNGFEVAGKDGVFYPAKARIRDGQVLLRSKKVAMPVMVRYAWSNTAVPTLFNAACLPASSFSTAEFQR